MKIIKIMTILILSLNMITGCKKKEEQLDNIKVNLNDGIIKEQQVEVFQFKNTSLIYENGMTSLETSVTNTSNKEEYLKEFNIQILNRNGNEIITLIGFIGDNIKPGETKIINSYCGEDLSTGTNIIYTIKR